MKKCKYCGEVKPYSDYKKHTTTKDGYFHICRKCDSEYQKKYRDRKSDDPIWCEKERQRTKQVYYKYQYAKKYKDYMSRFPEKLAAKNHSIHIKVEEGCVKHHWSYCNEHWKDIIPLIIADHKTAHKYLIYDQERMMFRTTDMVLLDSKDSHIEYINKYIK